MLYLVDTNILLRIFDRSDPNHSDVVSSLKHLRSAGHTLVTLPQNIAEFWNVSTRPAAARGGYGQTIKIVGRRLQFIERMGQILPEQPGAYAEWKEIITQFGVIGVSVHDARIVAAMKVASVTNILTLNADDFRRYSGISVMTPQEILA